MAAIKSITTTSSLIIIVVIRMVINFSTDFDAFIVYQVSTTLKKIGKASIMHSKIFRDGIKNLIQKNLKISPE